MTTPVFKVMLSDGDKQAFSELNVFFGPEPSRICKDIVWSASRAGKSGTTPREAALNKIAATFRGLLQGFGGDARAATLDRVQEMFALAEKCAAGAKAGGAPAAAFAQVMTHRDRPWTSWIEGARPRSSAPDTG